MAKTPTTPPTKKSAGQHLLDSLQPPSGSQPQSTQNPADSSTPEVPDTEPVAEQTVEEVAPETQTTEQPAAPQAPDFLAVVRDLGFADVNDEADARSRLVDAYRQQREQYDSLNKRVQEIEPLANYGREYLDTMRKPAQAPAAPEPTPPASWWNPPKVDPGLVSKYRKLNPETQQVEWSRETPAPVRAAAEQYETHIEEWTNKLIYRPDEAFKEPVRREVEQYLTEVMGISPAELPERLDINGERRLYETVVSQHGDRLFFRDPVTKQLDTDRLTPYGQTVQAQLERAAQMGISSLRDRMEYALGMAGMQHPVAAPPQPTLPEKREQIRRDVARRSGASGLPTRGGSETREDAPSPRPQNRNLTPGQQMRARLEGTIT